MCFIAVCYEYYYLYLQKLLCKEQKVAFPKPNVSLPGGLPSTSSEPRVPPLPSELIAPPAAPDHMITSSPNSIPSPGKRRKFHSGGKSSVVHPLTLNEQQQHEQKHNKRLEEHQQELSVHPALHVSMLHSLGDPPKIECMMVKEATRAGMDEDLAKELKECKIDLERIDQELLELGPFAKDMYHDLSSLQKSESNSLPLPGSVVPPRVPPLMSPPEVLIGLHQYQQQRQSPLRRSRKVSQQTSNGKIGGKDAKRRSEDGYVSSPMSASSVSLGEERTELHFMPERFLTRENEGGMREQQQNQKGKWRKVGSAGSPVIQPCSSKTTTTSYPHSSLGSSNSSSPMSDSSHTLPPTSTTAKVQKTKPRGGGGKGLDTDVSSPSMIPAASEIEMLSLYMPNSPWETIGSSPLHPEHDSTSDVQSAIGSSSTAEKVVDYHYKTVSDVLDPRSESTSHAPSQTGSRNGKISSGEDCQKLHSTAPVFVTGSNNWPSPLATSVARHSPGQLVSPRSECRGGEPTIPIPDALQIMPQSLPPGNELCRHVVVRDGTPVVMSSSSSSLKSGFSVTQLTTVQDQQQQQHYQNMSVPHGVSEHRSTTPDERISPPVSNAVGTHHPHHFGGIDISSGKNRRNSSSSSVRSIKQHQLCYDEGFSSSAQPSPLPTHTRVNVPRQTSSPLSQQALQQMQLFGGGPMGEVKSLNNVLGGGESTKLAMMNTAGGVSWLPCSTATAAAAVSQLPGQPNFLGPQTSIAAAASAMNAAGLSCYPFPNPFLPSGSWLPTAGGMLASTGLPHQLQPPMFSLDPNSAYKQVFNPTLIPYRYPLVTQPLKNFPSTSTQVVQSPSSLSGSNLKQTSAGTATPHSAMCPIGPSMSRSAFHSVGTEQGGVGVGGSRPSQPNSATPPLLCLPPTQPQGFPGMLSPAQVLTAGGKDDNGSNNNSKVAEAPATPQGVNWMQNPAALMGSAASFNVMPYLMSQAQLGITGPPGTQQALNMFNTPLHNDGSLAQMGGGAGGMTTAIASSQDHTMLPPRKPQPQRRGSSASVDLVRGEVSPSNTPPLGMGVGGGMGVALGGAKKSQYSIMMSQDVGGGGMWKPADPSVNSPLVIHPYEYQYPDATSSNATSFSSTSAMHMVNPSGHMMQASFPGMTATHPHSHLTSKGRGEMMMGGGRCILNDKPKLRMHHVRNDEFKLPVKPDRRRKRWRGKNKDSFLSARAELAEASLLRMGKVGEPLIASIPPFPSSMAVEPGSNKMGVYIPEKHVPQRDANTLSVTLPTTIAGSKDGNYALNMLADMSSIQSNREKQDGNIPTEIPSSDNTSHGIGNVGVSENTPTSLLSKSYFRHHLRSPVSLAARSLLMLGEDLSQSHDEKPKSHDVTHVENTAATSLLQLSGVMLSGNEESQTKLSDKSQNQRELETGEEMKDNGGHLTCSASFSAAEAMIMMGASKKSSRDATGMTSSYMKVFEISQHNRSPKSTDNIKSVGTIGKQEGAKPSSLCSKPQNLTLDSEVTDSDSEATLTPSPNARNDHSSFPNLFATKNEGNIVTSQGLHSHSPIDGESMRAIVECNPQKCVDGQYDDSSEIAVSRCCAPARLDVTGITRDYQSMTDCARVCTSERNHSNCSTLDVDISHLQDVYCTVVPPSAVPSSASFTVAGTFTPPPTFLLNKLLSDNDRDRGENKPPLAKLPKFISTFGPVSENETYPTLSLKIDGRTDDGEDNVADGPGPVLLTQVNQSLGVAVEKTSTEGEMDTLVTNTKEYSNINVGRQENERAILIDRKGDNSCESDSSRNEKHLEHETNSDDDDSSSNEMYGNTKTLKLEKRHEVASSKVETTKSVTSPRKMKEIVSSVPEKDKTKHRIITIKRNSSKMLSATSVDPPTILNKSLSDTKSRKLPSWTSFEDSVDQNDMNSDDERGRKDDKHVARMQASEELSSNEESDDEFDFKPSHLSSTNVRLSEELNTKTTKVEIDGSISSSSCSSAKVSSDVTCDYIDNTRDMLLATQNRLVISRSAKQQHRKRGTQLSKHGGSKKVKGSKFNKGQQEQKAKDLFDVEVPQFSERMSKREKMEKMGSESEMAKFSQQLTNKSPLSHSRQKMSACSEELENHHQGHLADLYSGSPAREGTRSHMVCDSDTILSTANKSQMWNQTSPGNHNQFSGTGSRVLEQAFSPLSDDDEIMSTSPMPCRVSLSKDSSKWSEVEEWGRKRMRLHEGEFADSAFPQVSSPSSSTSSSSAKNRHSLHHRYHERHPSGVTSKHNCKGEKSESTSRGSSPTEHKKHHRHHHHSSHHHTCHSHDEDRSLDGGSKQPLHEETLKDEIFIGAKSHLGNDDWQDSSGSMPGSVRCRKRMHISSDEDDKPLPEFSDGGALSVPNSRHKIKHREHKERLKESNKHKHGGHKH